MELGKEMSQKPFGFIGISARHTVRGGITAGTRRSQKPFGFIGISAQVIVEEATTVKEAVTKAFRLHWHFCLWHII